jgi:hypothetical protein
VNESLHPNAPHHLPGFITAPGDTDILMVVVGIVLIGAVRAGKAPWIPPRLRNNPRPPA